MGRSSIPTASATAGGTTPSTSTPSASTARNSGAKPTPSPIPSSTSTCGSPTSNRPTTPREAPDEPDDQHPVAPGDSAPLPGGDRRPGEGPRIHHDREGPHDHRGRRPLRRDLRERGRSATRGVGGGQGVDRPRLQEAAAGGRYEGLRRA